MGGRRKGPGVAARDRTGRLLGVVHLEPPLPSVVIDFDGRLFIPASVAFASSITRRFRVVPREDQPRVPPNPAWRDVPLPSEQAEKGEKNGNDACG